MKRSATGAMELGMRRIRIISIGRPRATGLDEAARDYLRRLNRYVPAVETPLRDGPAELSAAERSAREGRSILEALAPADRPIALDERGQTLASPVLARQLGQWLEDPAALPCFVIGGAYGLSDEVRSRCRTLLSLGPLTLPHELARVVLLEQLYRAMTILRGHPYHHG